MMKDEKLRDTNMRGENMFYLHKTAPKQQALMLTSLVCTLHAFVSRCVHAVNQYTILHVSINIKNKNTKLYIYYVNVCGCVDPPAVQRQVNW